jgi:hypothetical protein
MIRMFTLSAAVCLIVSCSHLGMRVVKTEYIREDYRGRIGRTLFVLEKLSADKGAESDRIRTNGEHILRVLFERRREAEKNPAGTLRARVRLKEESFIRDYRTVNTVTAEITLSETGTEHPAALSLYSEDTEETLSSYAYLYGLLLKAFGSFR